MKKNLWVVVAVLSVLFLSSCGGGGGGGDGGAVPAPATGTLSVGLTDAATTDYQAIYITIQEVAVHRDGGDWDVVATPNKTYNLLALVNGVREELGLATLLAGHYTQMRLILKDRPDDSLNIFSQRHRYGNYFIDKNGDSIELKVPSGFQTGIKIVQGFDINDDQTTELILDFDAARSIVMAGNNNKWLLKPTVKILDTATYSIIEGKADQAGALVSAQVYNGAATLPEDKVQIQAATVTDANGNYKLFVEPGSYTVVGYKDGYAPFYTTSKVVTTTGTVFAVPAFTLATTATGTLAGDVAIAGADQEQYVTISIRKDVTVSGNAEQIEVKSLNVADGGDFSETLPIGSYTLVVSTYGKTTQVVQPVPISANGTNNVGTISF